MLGRIRLHEPDRSGICPDETALTQPRSTPNQALSGFKLSHDSPMPRFTFRATSHAGDSTSNLQNLKSPPCSGGGGTRLHRQIVTQRVLGWIGCLILASFLAPASAASIKLAWDRNPERNIEGYEIYYGARPGNYPNRLDAGNETRATVSNLREGDTYYFVVVARNKAGLTGPKSAQISYKIPERTKDEPQGTITSPDDSVTIEAGAEISFSGSGDDPNGKTPLTYRWEFGQQSGIPDSSERNPGSRIFNEPGTYTVTFTVTNSLGISDPSPAVRTVIVRSPTNVAISQKGWKLEYVDSEEVTGYAATNAFDGNPATFWHTQFIQTALRREPHEIQIDMGAASLVSGFIYLSRQDGFSVGNIGSYQFYVSRDGKKWGDPVASGSFDSSTAKKKVFFTPKKGRYIRLRSISEVNGNTDSNVAELRVLTPSSAKSAARLSPAVQPATAIAASAAPTAPKPTVAGTTSPASTTLTTEIIDGKKYLSLTLAKPLAPDGVKRVIQVSPDLMDWFSGVQHTTVVTDNESILKVRDNTPVTRSGKRFIRLKETPP